MVNMAHKIPVGAHYGVGGWLAQRLSAVVMAVYTLLFALLLLFSDGPMTYASWKGLFTPGWMRFATFLFFASALIHAWVGMRDIWMDYIKHTGLRLALETLTVLVLAGCGGWVLQILWRI
jgi:succinate dehydrogenase / fumarate reductase membrane anchor subunit